MSKPTLLNVNIVTQTSQLTCIDTNIHVTSYKIVIKKLYLLKNNYYFWLQ